MQAVNADEQPATPPVSFRVTTYWKRPRGYPGITHMASRRILLSEALGWILSELPDTAVTISHDTKTDLTSILIDWSRVPGEIRYRKAAS